MYRAAGILGRILLAAIFIVSGFGKIMGFDASVGQAAQMGIPIPHIAIAVAAVVELGGGFMLAAGIRPGLAALMLLIFLIPTTLIYHTDFGNQMQQIQFLKNLAIMGGLLEVIAANPGTLAVLRWSRPHRLQPTA